MATLKGMLGMTRNLATAKKKGRDWETACAEWFTRKLRLPVERRRLTGIEDRGDLAGLPSLVVECKNVQAWDATGWLAECAVETRNQARHASDPNTLGIVMRRTKGKPAVEDSIVLMTPATFLELYQAYLDWLH